MKCCDITPGMLRHPVAIEEQVETDIGAGATELSWQTKGSARCGFKFLSGHERMYADRLDAQTRARVTIRYRADLLESDTLVIRGRRYNIRFIDNVELRDRWLVIDVDGGVAI